MNNSHFSTEREAIVFQNVRELVNDLRYVDVVDYVAFVRCELLGNIADIVNSAAELFFYPETLRFGHGGEVELGWDGPPKIALDLEFKNLGVNVYFRLVMTGEGARVDLHHLSFSEPDADPAANTQLLAAAFADARIPTRAQVEQRYSGVPNRL